MGSADGARCAAHGCMLNCPQMLCLCGCKNGGCCIGAGRADACLCNPSAARLLHAYHPVFAGGETPARLSQRQATSMLQALALPAAGPGPLRPLPLHRSTRTQPTSRTTLRPLPASCRWCQMTRATHRPRPGRWRWVGTQPRPRTGRGIANRRRAAAARWPPSSATSRPSARPPALPLHHRRRHALQRPPWLQRQCRRLRGHPAGAGPY